MDIEADASLSWELTKGVREVDDITDLGDELINEFMVDETIMANEDFEADAEYGVWWSELAEEYEEFWGQDVMVDIHVTILSEDLATHQVDMTLLNHEFEFPAADELEEYIVEVEPDSETAELRRIAIMWTTIIALMLGILFVVGYAANSSPATLDLFIP